MKKKILIFGPIGDFGGRELEVGFIAETLASQYDVDICTTIALTTKSQVFDFNCSQNVFSLNDLLFAKYATIKILSFLSYLKNNGEGIKSSYSNNAIAKKYFGYNKKRIIVARELIQKYDLLFICAQLSTSFVDEVIGFAKECNIKIVFRTTGAIFFSNYNYINSVDCFIHHSYSNANKMTNKHKYVIIDQCAYNEIDLLKVPISNNQVCKFLILSRLSPEKGVEEVIDFFLRVCSENDILFIAGNGVLENEFKINYEESNNIIFQGFVNSSNLANLFEEVDCLIIPSPSESGPLVGIESMCAGKIIISTRVGAMQERMQDTLNDYWYDFDSFESFKNVFFAVKRLSNNEIKNSSTILKEKYKMEYSIKRVREKYLTIVNDFLK